MHFLPCFNTKAWHEGVQIQERKQEVKRIESEGEYTKPHPPLQVFTAAQSSGAVIRTI